MSPASRASRPMSDRVDPRRVKEGGRDARDYVALPLDLVGHLIGGVERLVGDVRRDARAVATDSQRLWRATRRTVRDTKRASPRFARILTEGAWISALYRVQRARLVHLSEDSAAQRRDDLHRLAAARVRDLCLDLGGGVLKLGQFLSSRPDLLPAPWIQILAELQDRVPAEDPDAIAERVVDELGAPLDELFARFEREPMAAASLAQVHAAELHDGTPVAVKVQRPGIDEVIETDMAALRVLLGMTADLLPRFDHETVLGQLSQALRRELDFTAEAQSCAEIRALLAGEPDVMVPRVHPERSSTRVLTMERIHGQRLMDYLDTGEHRDHILATMIRATAAQVLVHGVFHADPHPGNFLVVKAEPRPKLAILDFGCVERLDADARAGYAAVVMAVAAGDDTLLAAALARMGFRTRDPEGHGLREIAKLMLDGVRPGSNGFADVDPRHQMERMMEMVRENPVVEIPGHFVLLGRVLGALGGLMMHYRPAVNLVGLLGPYLMAAQAQVQKQAATG